MSLGSLHTFGFGDELPLNPVEGGKSLLVTGPSEAGLEPLVHGLLAARDDEGLVAVSTRTSGRRFLRTQKRVTGGFDEAVVRVVECDGSTTRDDNVVSVPGPGYLTDINVHLSSLTDDLEYEGVEFVRAGIDSASPLVAAANDMRDIYRFLQNSISRTRRNDGLFVCALDPGDDMGEMGDGDHIVTGLSKAFQGQIELRESGGDAEIAVSGLDGQPEGWQSVDL